MMQDGDNGHDNAAKLTHACFAPRFTQTGRGAAATVQNQTFRELVRQRQHTYWHASRQVKHRLSSEIVKAISDLGGKFVRKIDSQSPDAAAGAVAAELPIKESADVWIEEPTETAFRKTKQALRERQSSTSFSTPKEDDDEGACLGDVLTNDHMPHSLDQSVDHHVQPQQGGNRYLSDSKNLHLHDTTPNWSILSALAQRQTLLPTAEQQSTLGSTFYGQLLASQSNALPLTMQIGQHEQAMASSSLMGTKLFSGLGTPAIETTSLQLTKAETSLALASFNRLGEHVQLVLTKYELHLLHVLACHALFLTNPLGGRSILCTRGNGGKKY